MGLVTIQKSEVVEDELAALRLACARLTAKGEKS